MKFFATTLALMASYASAMTPQQLATRWDMDEPDITYNSSLNKFTLDFPTASDLNVFRTGMQEEFYDVNCKDDGSGFPEIVVNNVFSDPGNPGDKPEFTLDGANNKPQLEFIIETQEAANNNYIYEVVGEDPTQCIGQYYNMSLNINITTSVAFDQSVSDIQMTVYERDAGSMTNFKYQTTNADLNGKQNQTVEFLIEDLCRGVDYVFNFTDSGGDGLAYPEYTGGSVSGYYTMANPNPQAVNITKNLIFTKPGNEVGAGFSSLFNLPLNPQNPATNIQDRDGQGMVKFCVRSSFGYGGQSDQQMSLALQMQNGYQEVNFIETLITVFYDLTAGFTVLDFNVDPKEREETTVSKDTYGLIAWLCPSSTAEADLVPTPFEFTATKLVPPGIDAGYTATDPTQKKFFNQGALITVCVAPDDLAWADGIRMNGINEFNWVRDDLSSTAPTLVNPGPISQNAITGQQANSNALTSYDHGACLGAHYCQFSSILFADFYISTGVVGGSGDANLIFAAPGSRRLGAPEAEGRQLQDDEAAQSPFDVNVPVEITDTGPAGLKTAAGVSFTTSTLTLAMALIGAALLA